MEKARMMMTPASNGGVLIPFRLRAVKVAATATYLIVGSMLLFPLLPGRGPTNVAGYIGVLVFAAVAVTLIVLLPWRRLFDSGYGLWCMYAWSAIDIVLITVLVALQGERHGDMFFVYALTTVFFGVACYPIRAQAGLLIFTFAAYLGILWYMPWKLEYDMVFLRLAILASAAYLSTTLSRELSGQIDAHGSAREESEERARLLAIVAGATRSMTSLDQQRVFRSVIEAVGRLGFEASNVVLFDREKRSFRVVQSRGLPDEYAQAEHPWDLGMPGLVMESKSTVVVDDYASLPNAVPILKEQGYRSVVAAPVWIQDTLGGALVGGTRNDRRLNPEQVEAFELLASLVGRALENARAYETERQAVERLAELDRLKSDFLSNVSHELRTPLTSIQGMTTTILERWNTLDEEARLHLLERVGANASSLGDIISSLLDFSTLEAGQLRLSEKPFDVGDLVTGVTVRLSNLFDDHILSTTIVEGLIAKADPVLIERVIENLVSNASKHTKVGSRVSVSVVESDGRAVISVTDDGDGIPESDLKNLGGRFFRGGDTNTRATRGVGLGLALAKEILALHGLELSIQSQVGEGSSFGFSLPLGSQTNLRSSSPKSSIEA